MSTAEAPKEVTIADRLEMSLDDIAKLDRKKKQQERKEAQEKRKSEKAAAGGQKSDKKQSNTPKKGGEIKKDGKQSNQKKPQSAAKSTATAGNSSKKPISAKQQDKPPITTGTPVLVSNVDPKVDPNELKDIFEAVGPVKAIEILPEKGKQPAAAKITFKLKADAEKAIDEFNDRELDGKQIKVKLARKRVVLGSGGRGGGGDKPRGAPSQPQFREPKHGNGQPVQGGGGNRKRPRKDSK